MEDLISPTLRKVEEEIDSEYLKNPLTKLSFPEACWYFLAFFEDTSILNLFMTKKFKVYEQAVILDNHLFNTKYSVNWLYASCIKEGSPTYEHNGDTYNASRMLMELSRNYDSFYSAYTLASRGYIGLGINKDKIVQISRHSNELQYDAYDLLIKQTNSFTTLGDISSISQIKELVKSAISVSDDSFHYQKGKRILSKARDLLKPIFETLKEFPDNWVFGNYSVHEFREMYKAIFTWAFIQNVARLIAAQSGCQGMGIKNSVIVVSDNYVNIFLAKFADVSFHTATQFIDDYTYGGRGIRFPDPVIQPLIKINHSFFAISPNLITGNSIERNFSILLNRIPDERQNYLNLVSEKEGYIRNKIIQSVDGSRFRFYYGKLNYSQGLPDVDLAIIDDQDKCVIFVELKWFIHPAETREILEKGQEIQKGISQLLVIKDAYLNEPSPIYTALNIDKNYYASFALVSDNFIGEGWDQHQDIPVIQVDHFLRKINKEVDFHRFIEWLNGRLYLPVEGKDYKVINIESKIGKWKMQSKAISPLAEALFDS